jgi:thymidylate kinase
LAFIVLEGFSGTGKTTLAKELEGRGWLRLTESAHAVSSMVPLAERADTFADYSLLGATMVHSAVISKSRETRNIVSEGYMLSDLAYARIRYDLKTSECFPAMLAFCRDMLTHDSLRPDLYILLQARPDTIERRQQGKDSRNRNVTEFFRTHYYSALMEIHQMLGENQVERIDTDSDTSLTLQKILEVLKKRNAV